MHVLNLSERSNELSITIEPSLAAELVSSLCAFSVPADYQTFELGEEWFTARTATLPTNLLTTIMLFSAPGTRLWTHLLGLIHDTQPPRDVPAFLTTLEETSNEELRRHLLGFYQAETTARRDLADLAASGDQGALDTLLTDYFPDPTQREQLREAFLPDPVRHPEATKRTLLQTLHAWYDAVFREMEPGIAPILEHDARAKQSLQRGATADRLLDIALNGVDYSPEPGIREVVLIPSYHWRPWVVLTDYRDLKLIVYPVADDSISAENSAPPARLVKLYKALGDERRLRALKKLSSQDASLQDLADYLGLAKSTMHHHLTILRSAGLVRVRLSGNGDMHYSLQRDFVPEATALLRDFLA